jgi:phage gp16-like protein
MKNTRQALLAKVHIAKEVLGMDDDGYRDFLQAQTGKRSAGLLNEIELDRVLAQMKRMGFKPQAKDKGKRPTTPKKAWSRSRVMAKITAQLATRELHWNYAHAMAKAMFKKERLEWLYDEQLYKLMQALQVDQERRKDKGEIKR